MEPLMEQLAKEMAFELRTYNALTKQIVQTRNRATSYGIDPENLSIINGLKTKDGRDRYIGLEQMKARQARRILRMISGFPVWTDWLANVPGIGPWIGGTLINLYYFRFVPICPTCGGDLESWTCVECNTAAKGNGNLVYRVALRDFPSISSWWHYMGRHVVGGKMPKYRRSEEKNGPRDTWSAEGRLIGHHIKEAFNRMPTTHLYRAYAEKRKAYRETTHPDATRGHRHNMAWNETVKLFLSHFWQVARTLDGLPLTDPYPVAHMGHDRSSIIEPFYWQ